MTEYVTLEIEPAEIRRTAKMIKIVILSELVILLASIIFAIVYGYWRVPIGWGVFALLLCLSEGIPYWRSRRLQAYHSMTIRNNCLALESAMVVMKIPYSDIGKCFILKNDMLGFDRNVQLRLKIREKSLIISDKYFKDRDSACMAFEKIRELTKSPKA